MSSINGEFGLGFTHNMNLIAFEFKAKSISKPSMWFHTWIQNTLSPTFHCCTFYKLAAHWVWSHTAQQPRILYSSAEGWALRFCNAMIWAMLVRVGLLCWGAGCFQKQITREILEEHEPQLKQQRPQSICSGWSRYVQVLQWVGRYYFVMCLFHSVSQHRSY